MNDDARTGVELAPAPAIRRALASLDELREHLSAEDLKDARLLVGELVTNARRHTGPGPDDDIRGGAEVCDHGLGFDASRPPRDARGDQERGWSLYIVERVSGCWEVEWREGSTCVCFELHRDPAPREGAYPGQGTRLTGEFSAAVRVVEGRAEASPRSIVVGSKRPHTSLFCRPERSGWRHAETAGARRPGARGGALLARLAGHRAQSRVPRARRSAPGLR